MNRIAIPLLTTLALACGAQSLENKREKNPPKQNEKFGNYWYSGNAELNRFELSQERYGELRQGNAVLVFVTEDFLLEKQVKKERTSPEQAASILKLNKIKKFQTGIYDYSIMTSVFSPMSGENPLKVTSSSQEWCGHTWLQINKRKGVYQIQGNSYFEMEGDRQIELEEKRTEDGLWNQIRINPEDIEEGEFTYLPSSEFLRLRHKGIRGYAAMLSKSAYKKEDMPGANLQSIRLDYPDLDRRLEIIYENEFPFRIAGWKESLNLNAEDGKKSQTIARRTHLLQEPYWNLNANRDSTYRSKLGLD